jgi:hypothetical protein
LRIIAIFASSISTNATARDPVKRNAGGAHQNNGCL